MRAFKVGDKVTSEEFGDGVVNRVDARMLHTIQMLFYCGLTEFFTKEGFYWLDNRDPHKNIKHKEAKGMNKSDLKTGMVVEYRNGDRDMVLKDAGIFTDGEDGLLMSEFSDDLIHEVDRDHTIVKVYDAPADFLDYINLNASRTLIWQREEVKEMTVDEISKALGYTVKVVGGE